MEDLPTLPCDITTASMSHGGVGKTSVADGKSLGWFSKSSVWDNGKYYVNTYEALSYTYEMILDNMSYGRVIKSYVWDNIGTYVIRVR